MQTFAQTNISPDVYIQYSPATTTNKNVIAKLQFRKAGYTITSKSNTSNPTDYNFADNNSFNFTYTDPSKNPQTIEAKVTWIDRTKPTAIFFFTGSTNTLAILTGFNKTGVTVTNNNNSKQFNFTPGVTGFTFLLQDLA